MEPFVKYPGGKSKELPIIKDHLPENISRYFEPFVGGGSIYFGLEIKKSFINDKSKDLINLYKMIKEQNQSLKDRLVQIDYMWKLIEEKITKKEFQNKNFDYEKFDYFLSQSENKKAKTISKFKSQGIEICDDDKAKIDITSKKTAFYMLIRHIYNTTSNIIEKTASFYFLREYCYSSMFRFSSKGEFNVPYGGMSYNSKYLNNKISKMFSDEMGSYMRETLVFDNDYETFLNKFELTKDDFIFLDPPYDSDFSTYDNNSFDKNEQIRLRDCLAQIKAKWMLVIKETDFIKELYKDFNIVSYDKKYSVSFKNRNDRDALHLLITNY